MLPPVDVLACSDEGVGGAEGCKKAGKSEEATFRMVEGDADEAVLSTGSLLLIFSFPLSLSLGNAFGADCGVACSAKGRYQSETTPFRFKSFNPGAYMHAAALESCRAPYHRSNPGNPVHAGRCEGQL